MRAEGAADYYDPGFSAALCMGIWLLFHQMMIA